MPPLIALCRIEELLSSTTAGGEDCMTGTKIGRPLLSDSRVYSDPMGSKDGGASLYCDAELLDSIVLLV